MANALVTDASLISLESTNNELKNVVKKLVDLGDVISLVFLLSEPASRSLMQDLHRFIETKKRDEKAVPSVLLENWERNQNESSRPWKEPLQEAFFCIKRYDILRELGTCKHQMDKKSSSFKYISRFRRMLYNICEDLNDDEARQLLQRETIVPSGYVYLELYLMEWIGSGKLSESNYIQLKADLYQIGKAELGNRFDLVTAHAPTDRYYPMNKNPCGICLIINQRDFSRVEKDPALQAYVEYPPLSNRSGTEVDAEVLKETFASFNFSIRLKENLTHLEMEEECRRLASEDHSDYNALVVVILSHGKKDHVFGCNSVATSISKLVDSFKAERCKSLIGKPKLFFIQACLGGEYTKSINMDSYYMDTQADSVESDSPVNLANNADVLLALSTTPGCRAYRSVTKGSWYITTLCETLKERGDSDDILGILTDVNRKVSSKVAPKDGELCTQIPEPRFRLTKRLRFVRSK